MLAISRTLAFVLLAVHLCAVTRATEPQTAVSTNGQERQVAHDLLIRAKKVLDAQYQARPQGGYRYTDALAAALIEVGEFDAAKSTFDHLSLDDRFGDVHLRILAVGYARGGDIERVRQTIARIKDADQRYARQRPLAWNQAGKAFGNTGHDNAAAKSFDEAIRSLLPSPEYPSLDAGFLMEVAEGQFAIGRADDASATLEKAVALAFSVPKNLDRVSTLSKVAAAYAKLGFLSKALTTVDQISESQDRAGAWSRIVEAEVGAGRLEAAYEVAERVDGHALYHTWMVLAGAEVSRGNLTEAKRALQKAENAVEQMNDVGFRIQQVVALADLRAAVNDRGGAANWLRKASDLAEGAVIVERGPFAALRQIEQKPGVVARKGAHCIIAASQAKLGFQEEARRSFELAKITAYGQQPGLWQDAALTGLAAAQAKAGFPDDAMQTLSMLPTDAVEWRHYVPIIVAKIKTGDLMAAQKIIDMHALDASATYSFVSVDLYYVESDPENALRFSLKSQSSAVEEILHDSARKLASSKALNGVTDIVPRTYFDQSVAILLGTADGLLDRTRGDKH